MIALPHTMIMLINEPQSLLADVQNLKFNFRSSLSCTINQIDADFDYHLSHIICVQSENEVLQKKFIPANFVSIIEHLKVSKTVYLILNKVQQQGLSDAWSTLVQPCLFTEELSFDKTTLVTKDELKKWDKNRSTFAGNKVQLQVLTGILDKGKWLSSSDIDL